jgi:Ca2+-binding EF-hand superfamily protein
MASEFQIKKYRHMFDAFDTTSDGSFDQNDTMQVVAKMAELRGIAADSPQYTKLRGDYESWWQMLGAQLDADHDGRVTQEEFVSFWVVFADHAQAGNEALASLLIASGEMNFDLLDSNSDGEISLEEYTDWLKAQNIDTDYEACFGSLDLNNDGILNRDEAGMLLRNFILSDNPEAPGNLLYGNIG